MSQECKLKHFSSENIKEKYKQQLKNEHCDWSFYSEREFLENLLTKRFNFLLVTYSFFLISGLTVKDDQLLELSILCLGSIVMLCLSIAIYRIYKKLNTVLRILYSLDDYHVFNVVHTELYGKKKSFSVNPIIAYIVPILLTASFPVYLIYKFNDFLFKIKFTENTYHGFILVIACIILLVLIFFIIHKLCSFICSYEL